MVRASSPTCQSEHYNAKYTTWVQKVLCASQPTASQSGPYWMMLRYQQAEYIACNPALVTAARLSGFPFHTSTTVSGLTYIQGDTSREHSIVSNVPVMFVTHARMNTHLQSIVKYLLPNYVTLLEATHQIQQATENKAEHTYTLKHNTLWE